MVSDSNLTSCKKAIYDSCDVLADKVWCTFQLFNMVCPPNSSEQYEHNMLDSMEVWECL